LLVLGGFAIARMAGGGGRGPSVGVVAVVGAEEGSASGGNTKSSKEMIAPAPSTPERPPQATELQPPRIEPRNFFVPPNRIQPEDVETGSSPLSRIARNMLQHGPGPANALSGGPAGPSSPGLGSGTSNTIEQERVKRLMRWTMTFNTRDGRDYLSQLKSLGAMLAYGESEGKYRLIRDLGKRPVNPEVDTLEKMNRIFWVDNRPESVKSLAGALGIAAPKQFIAFFPEVVERDLLQKELKFAGREEKDIGETQFSIVRTPRGYEPKVVSQTSAK
jgi:hypothetical protein